MSKLCSSENSSKSKIRVESPNLLITVDLKKSKKFSKFEEFLNSHFAAKYKDLEYVNKKLPAKGELVVVNHEGKWFRGIVQEVIGSDIELKLIVYLIDCGTTLRTSASKCFHLPEGTFSEVPYKAQQVKINNVAPTILGFSLNQRKTDLILKHQISKYFSEAAHKFVNQLKSICSECIFYKTNLDSTNCCHGDLFFEYLNSLKELCAQFNPSKSTEIFNKRVKFGLISLSDLLVCSDFAEYTVKSYPSEIDEIKEIIVKSNMIFAYDNSNNSNNNELRLPHLKSLKTPKKFKYRIDDSSSSEELLMENFLQRPKLSYICKTSYSSSDEISSIRVIHSDKESSSFSKKINKRGLLGIDLQIPSTADVKNYPCTEAMIYEEESLCSIPSKTVRQSHVLHKAFSKLSEAKDPLDEEISLAKTNDCQKKLLPEFNNESEGDSKVQNLHINNKNNAMLNFDPCRDLKILGRSNFASINLTSVVNNSSIIEPYENCLNVLSTSIDVNIARTYRVYNGGGSQLASAQAIITKDRLKDCINKHILSTLLNSNTKNKNEPLISRLQAYSWKTLCMGSSACFMVSASNSGKSLGYIIPILSSIFDDLASNKKKKNRTIAGIGPTMIVICPSWKNVCAVSMLIENHTPKGYLKVLSVWGGMGAYEEEILNIQVLNGCDILITTSKCLQRLLKTRHSEFLISLSKCCHLIFEDLHQFSDDTLQILLDVANLWAKSSFDMSIKVSKQIIITSTYWTKKINNLYMELTSILNFLPSLIIASHLEAAIANKINVFSIYVKKDIFKEIVKIVKEHEQNKILIFTEDDQVYDNLPKFLESIAVTSKNIDHNYERFQIENLISCWNESSSYILIINEKERNPVMEFDLRNADLIIHATIPKEKVSFGKRFSFMLDHYPQDISKGCDKKAFVLLTDTCISNSIYILSELQRLDAKLSPELEMKLTIAAKEIEKSKQTNFCYMNKAFGHCPYRNCLLRHTFITKDIVYQLPIEGKIQFEILNVIDASCIFIRILSYCTPKSVDEIDVKFYFYSFFMKMQQYFSSQKRRIKVEEPEVGYLCATNVKGVWSRAKLLKVDYKGNVDLYLIDEGKSLLAVTDIFHLPCAFKNMPPFATEAYICKIQPIDGDFAWTNTATAITESMLIKSENHLCFQAKISLAIGNVLWLSPVYELINIGGEIISKQSIRSRLLSLKFGENNPSHIKKLMEKLDESNLQFSIQENNWMKSLQINLKVVESYKIEDLIDVDRNSEKIEVEEENSAEISKPKQTNLEITTLTEKIIEYDSYNQNDSDIIDIERSQSYNTEFKENSPTSTKNFNTDEKINLKDNICMLDLDNDQIDDYLNSSKKDLVNINENGKSIVIENLLGSLESEIESNDLNKFEEPKNIEVELNSSNLELFCADPSDKEVSSLPLKEEILKLNEFVNVDLAEIVSPKCFYVTKLKHQEKLKALEDHIQEIIPNLLNIKLPDKCICLAQFSENRFYRAEILSTEDNLCSVFFIDHGETLGVRKSKIYPCPPEIYETLPAQAIKCKLNDIENIKFELSSATKIFKNLIDCAAYWTLEVLDIIMVDDIACYIVELFNPTLKPKTPLSVLFKNQLSKLETEKPPPLCDCEKFTFIKYPITEWSQNERKITLRINVSSIDEYECRFKSQKFRFITQSSSSSQDWYIIDAELYSKINPENSFVVISEQNVVVSLEKFVKGEEWIRLRSSEEKVSWLKRDWNNINIIDSDNEIEKIDSQAIRKEWFESRQNNNNDEHTYLPNEYSSYESTTEEEMYEFMT